MYKTRCVLALLVLYVGLVHSFSWDIVVSGRKQLQFYNNGTLTHTEAIPSSTFITSIAYDPVHNRVLIGGTNQISSFDIATRKTQTLIYSNLYGNIRIAYDPASMLLFWIEQGNSLNSILLKPGYYNKVNLNIYDLQKHPKDRIKDIAVDSCGGYIYWTTDKSIERGRFDGSLSEVLNIDRSHIRREAMVIDQQTQKIYWLEQQILDTGLHNTIESADLNVQNRITLHSYRDTGKFKALTVSKDFIILGLGGTYWEIPKDPRRGWNVKPKQFLSIPDIPHNGLFVQGLAYNYKIEEQTPEIQNCDALRVPSGYDSLNDSIAVSLLCVHGKKVSGESRCECTQGYSGERCEVPVCQNYCFQGDCTVSAEGQPKCRCKAGYSGERCEVNACHEYCSNNGICSLNAESKPVCQCTGQYEGERCDVPVFFVKCLQTVSLLRDILNTDVTQVTLGKGVKSTRAPTDV